jgi:glycosyltransferase involved in cell wall biosynthesis
MLVRLIERLNRDEKRNVRLILTGKPEHDRYLNEYISEHKLEAFVLSAHDLSSELLAAFNACAALSITPTLFEGGFPFTFCEAYSVGTPSILSDIPVIREVLNDHRSELVSRTLFNPYDLEDLVQKAGWALDNRALLYTLQEELFESFPTWEQVAETYVSTILKEAHH